MPSGAPRLVLDACMKLPADPAGFVTDLAIQARTRLGLQDVRNCILSLAEERYVSLARLEDDSLKAMITPKGRLSLSQTAPTKGQSKVGGDNAEPLPFSPRPRPYPFGSFGRPLLYILTPILASLLVLGAHSLRWFHLEPLRRWGEVSTALTTFLPALGGAAAGMLFLGKALRLRVKAIVLIAALASTCILPALYNWISGTPPTPANIGYYGGLCYVLLLCSYASLGFLLVRAGDAAMDGLGRALASQEVPSAGGIQDHSDEPSSPSGPNNTPHVPSPAAPSGGEP
jgi:hypothetical protein